MLVSLFSLLLLGISGWLLDAESRARWQARLVLTHRKAMQSDQLRFARRTTATVLIAVVATMLLFWPIVPQRPRFVMVYTGILLLLTVLILALGLIDGLVLVRRQTRRLREEGAQQHAELQKVIEQAIAREQQQSHTPDNSPKE